MRIGGPNPKCSYRVLVCTAIYWPRQNGKSLGRFLWHDIRNLTFKLLEELRDESLDRFSTDWLSMRAGNPLERTASSLIQFTVALRQIECPISNTSNLLGNRTCVF